MAFIGKPVIREIDTDTGKFRIFVIPSDKSKYPVYMKMDRGWGNGYVTIPFGHPCWGVSYDDIDVSVHGGLTYGKYALDSHQWQNAGVHYSDYIVGFDTTYYQDNLMSWPEERVIEEVKRLREQLMRL